MVVEQLAERERAGVPVEVLRLGHHVVGAAGEPGLDGGRLTTEAVDQVPGAVERGEEALGAGVPGACELHQLDDRVRVAVDRVPRGQPLVQLGPEERRLLGVLGGDQREVLVHPEAEQDRARELAGEVRDVGLADAGDADAPPGRAGVGGLTRRERDDLAVAADRALHEVGEPGELALHLVAPARLGGLVVLTVVVADLAAEDVAGVLLEVAARDDALVRGVEGVQLPAAGAEEQEVGDEHRAGEDRLASLLVDARQPVRGGEVVPLEHLLAQRH